MNTQVPLICSSHPGRPVRYICLADECPYEPKSCILCVKNSHPKCPSDLFVTTKRFLEKIKINNNEHTDFLYHKDYVKKLIDQIQKEVKFKLQKTLLNKRKTTVKLIDIDFTELEEKDLEYIRKNFTVMLNEETGRIEFKSLAHCGAKGIKSSLVFHQLCKKQLVKRFLKGLERVRFNFKCLTPKDFEFCEKNIILKPDSGGVKASRKNPSIKSYSCLVYRQPLEDHVFKIKITGIHSDSFLDIGVTTETRLNSMRSNSAVGFGNSFGSNGNISYCGTSTTRMKNLAAPLPKHAVGKEIFLKFEKEIKKVYIYNESKSLNLTNSSLLANENYYFFIALHYPESSCDIEMDNC